MRDVESELQGRDVVIVDDILDSGRTLAFAKTMLDARGSRSVRTCMLIDKQVPRAGNDRARLFGFRCKPVFVVGYGMDLAHRYRELPFIGEVRTMTTLTLIVAVIGALIPPVVIVQALRSKATDRWPEGCWSASISARWASISLIYLVTYFRFDDQNGLIRRSR